MTKKWDLETSNAETELKIEIYAKNWAKQVRLKIFDNGQSQRSESTVNTDVCWRGNMTSPKADVAEEKQQQARVAREYAWAGTCGAREAHGRYQRRVAARGGACSWGRNFSQRVEARVMQFLAVLGWVLLGIGRSVFLCLLFGSWTHRTLISECCRYCERDGDGSLLTVTTRWRRGQRKNARDVYRNQKVRRIALIPC